MVEHPFIARYGAFGKILTHLLTASGTSSTLAKPGSGSFMGKNPFKNRTIAKHWIQNRVKIQVLPNVLGGFISASMAKSGLFLQYFGAKQVIEDRNRDTQACSVKLTRFFCKTSHTQRFRFRFAQQQLPLPPDVLLFSKINRISVSDSSAKQRSHLLCSLCNFTTFLCVYTIDHGPQWFNNKFFVYTTSIIAPSRFLSRNTTQEAVPSMYTNYQPKIVSTTHESNSKSCK